MAPVVIPLIIMAARMVATRRLAAAATVRLAQGAAPNAAQRAATFGVNQVNRPVVSQSFLGRVPVVRGLVNQPRLFGKLNPPAAGSGSKLSSALQRANLRQRMNSPLLRDPNMGAIQKTARTLASLPAATLRMASTPKQWIPYAETGIYAGAIGSLQRAAGNREQRPAQARASSTTPFTPYSPYSPAQAFTPYAPYAPAAPAARRTSSRTPGVVNPRVRPTQANVPPAGAPPVVPPTNVVPPTTPTPPPTPPVEPTPTGGLDPAIITQDENNRNQLNTNLAAIGAGFDQAARQIKQLYSLSETEEEKELLRFQLADLEAQVKAGEEAVRSLFAEKTANLQLMARQSREQGAQSAQEVGALYSDAGTNLQALQEARRTAQTERNRGLGIGTSSLDAEYSGLLQTMAPIAQASAQQISDIGSQGLDFLGGLSESMGAARQGELQSLNAARNATIRESYMQQVLDRINSDRSEMNQQLGSLYASKASAVSSAIQKFKDEGGDPTMAEVYEQMNLLAQDGVPPGEIDAYMAQLMPGATISPEFKAQYQQWFDAFRTDRDLSLRKSTGEANEAEAAAIRERIAALQLAGGSQAEINELLRRLRNLG